jgi:hypothetical protein
VSHLSEAFPSCEVALCIIATTLVIGDCFLIAFATPLNAGASAECQNGRSTKSTLPCSRITEAVFRHEFGEMESIGASGLDVGRVVPVLVWVLPGKSTDGY